MSSAGQIPAQIALVVLAISPAWGATLSVPGDFPTIRKAVKAAAAGDTVQVSFGVYQQRVNIRHTDNLSLIGLADGDGNKPTLQPEITKDGVRIRESAGVVISGFRIEGGRRGIHVAGESVNAVISGNDVMGSGAGIRVGRGGGHLLNHNTVDAVTTGPGVDIRNAHDVVVSQTTVTEGTRAGISVRRSTRIAVDTNIVTGSGKRGIRAVGGTGILVTGNQVSGSARAGIRIRNCNGGTKIDGNNSYDNGRSGLIVLDSPGTAVTANVADRNVRYGIRVDHSAPIKVVADLLRAGNAAVDNGKANLRVNFDVE